MFTIIEVEDQTTVLDHGYVKLIEVWGSEERIVEAARMSTGKGFQGWGPKHTAECLAVHEVPYTCKCPAGDEKLLSYLYNNKHMTPFEMAGLVLEIQAPIFVFREWHRHRTQSYNEMSARYIPIPDEHYMPVLSQTISRMVNAQASVNKQAMAAGKEPMPVVPKQVADWLGQLKELYDHAELVYRHGLGIGIPKEVARLPMPVGRYSRMRASANLRNWLGFLTLRDSPHAQWEIQQYARVVSQVVFSRFPRVWALFDQGRE